MSFPTNNILQKAINQVKTGFTKEILEFAFIPSNKNHFGISVINVRENRKILLDYTFTIKTGRLVKCDIIENNPL